MNNIVVMKPVLVVLDTAGIISRCWELYGVGPGGSDFRNHQRSYFYRLCKKMLQAMAIDVFNTADPEVSSFILGDFTPVVRKIILDWGVKDAETDDDPSLISAAEYMLDQFLRLLVMAGLYTADLTRMSFVTWSGNDMVVRIRIVG